jgi:hypothetical protein
MRKYTPGHNVTLMRNYDSRAEMAAAIVPGITKTVMKRYTHASLEPEFDKYEFDEVAHDLHAANAQNVKLIVYIEDKTFTNENPMPSYMAPALCLQNRAGGITAARWNPEVLARQCALVSRLGVYFDGHVAFAGVAFEESAPSVDDALLMSSGYTPEKYRDYYISLIAHSAAALPTSLHYQHFNFVPYNQSGSYIGEVVDAVKGYGNLVFGGPDCLPNNKALVDRTYWLYEKYKSEVPMFIQCSPGCYNAPGLTAAEVYLYARDELHVDTLMWCSFKWGKEFSYSDAVEVMKRNPVYP